MKKTQRAELHLHTKLSDSISVIDPKEALEYAIAHSHKAIAFTNLNNVQDFHTIADAYRQCGNSNLKVIYGAELCYSSEDGTAPYYITALCKNQLGIKELYTIISSIKNDGICDLTSWNVINQNRKNLLIGSCGNNGELYKAVAWGTNPEKAAGIYDYFEIYPTEDKTEQTTYKKIYELGSKLSIPVAATGNCHFLDEGDEVCCRIINVVNGNRDNTKKLFYHSTDEMLAEFSYLGEDEAYKSVVTNTNKIADLIAPVLPMKERSYSLEAKNAYGQIQKLVYAKAKEIYGNIIPVPIAERLDAELERIQEFDEYAFYYWIAHCMVKYMNDSGYYVDARGSIGSMLVAFLLGISDINPLPAHYYCSKCHHIIFETTAPNGFDLPNRDCPVCGCLLNSDGHDIPYEAFTGFFGDKTPDINLYFPASKQHSEFMFMQKLFGTNNVAYASTITTLQKRSAAGYVSVYEAITDDCFTEEQRDFICEKLCGIKLHDRIQPGGIVVSTQERNFENITPLRKVQTLSPIKNAIHLDYHSLIDAVVKLDVLGDPVPDFLKLLEEFTDCSIQSVIWNEPEIYVLFARADTLGIPGFDTNSIKDILLKLKPKSISDLVQISGLLHGTGIRIDNCDKLYNSHKLSELPAFKEDIFLRLMQYGLGRSSSFQTAEYVWNGELQYNNDTTFKYIECMRDKNVPEWYIQSLQKVQYLFPKAYAIANVMNAVRMAWFKIHYPTEFYAAYLSCYLSGNKCPNEEDERRFQAVVDECSQKGIQLLNPDAEKSHLINYLPELHNIRMPHISFGNIAF